MHAVLGSIWQSLQAKPLPVDWSALGAGDVGRRLCGKFVTVAVYEYNGLWCTCAMKATGPPQTTCATGVGGNLGNLHGLSTENKCSAGIFWKQNCLAM